MVKGQKIMESINPSKCACYAPNRMVSVLLRSIGRCVRDMNASAERHKLKGNRIMSNPLRVDELQMKMPIYY